MERLCRGEVEGEERAGKGIRRIKVEEEEEEGLMIVVVGGWGRRGGKLGRGNIVEIRGRILVYWKQDAAAYTTYRAKGREIV